MDTLGRVIEKNEEGPLKPNYKIYSENYDKNNQKGYALVLEIDIPGINKIYEIIEEEILAKEGYY